MKSLSTNCNKHFDSSVFLDAEKEFSILIRNEIKDFIKKGEKIFILLFFSHIFKN